MIITQLQNIIQKQCHKFNNYSLHDLANKKIKQLLSKHIITINDVDDNKFFHSDVLHENEAKDLFYNLPFFMKSPKVKKIYSTFQHNRSLDDMYAKTVKVRMMMII